MLEHSIRKTTKADVQIVPMIGPEWEYSTAGLTVGTGFSLRRWMIPEFCNWKGRAIYLDADQLVLSDIADLWTKPDQQPSADASIWCTYQPDKYNKTPAPQTSVMVIDCERAQREVGWHIANVLSFLKGATREKYAKFMHCQELVPGSNPEFNLWHWWTAAAPTRIEKTWNNLNVYTLGHTKLLHYTKEPEQPWYKPSHPLAYLWKTALKLALADGAVTAEEVKAAVAKFGVKEDWRPTNGLHPDYLKFVS